VTLPSTAMIMAAGKGTRMMPLTATTPKPLIGVAGTTLIDHVLDHLRAAGVGRIVVNVHYLADQMEAHLARAAGDFDVAISDERDLLRDTGGGLVKARPLIEADPFFCINADNWWTDEGGNALVSLANAWRDDRMDALLLLIPIAKAGNWTRRGDFDRDAAGRISWRSADGKADYVWTGIQLLSKRLIADPPSEVFSTAVFWTRAIDAGRAFGHVHRGAWFDVGYPEAIAATEAALGHG
jgi:N-acetyl-alpha-D-muramate 1-phosphate uridylyltransferase